MTDGPGLWVCTQSVPEKSELDEKQGEGQVKRQQGGKSVDKALSRGDDLFPILRNGLARCYIMSA